MNTVARNKKKGHSPRVKKFQISLRLLLIDEA